MAAFSTLPEWRVPLPRGRFLEKVRSDVASAGGKLTKARVRLKDGASRYERAYRLLGPAATAYLTERDGAVLRWIDGTLEIPGGGTGPVAIELSPSGAPVSIDWAPGGSIFTFSAQRPEEVKARRDFLSRISPVLLEGRERTGEEVEAQVPNNPPARVERLRPVPGRPAEVLTTAIMANGVTGLTRELEDPHAPSRFSASGALRKVLVAGTPRVVLGLGVVGLLLALLIKRRLSFRIALRLGLLAAVSMLIGGVGPTGSAVGGGLVVAAIVGSHVVSLLFVVALWAVAESLLRDTVPGFTTSLDGLASGRLGPRAGVALLSGLGAGAALAGLRLLLHAAAVWAVSAGVRPTAPSFSLPLFGGFSSPFLEGPFLTALFVLPVALFRFVLPRGVANAAGATLFALYVSVTVPLHPWGAALAGALAVAVVALALFQRHGFAALLVAFVSAALFRETLVAARLAGENAGVLSIGLLALAAIAVAGATGLGRPEAEGDGREVVLPEYLRRLETERRVKYEMDLLARMQLALLPERPPAGTGFDIAVKTILATEAGGDLFDFVVDDAGHVWIAAGDVAGHGYSCGIQQAMVKASLASLVKADRRPGEILGEVDRVLRIGKSTRHFTSLALLKLDPVTGEGLFANAGHPFPVCVVEGRVSEIAVPSFPLGQGPRRTYEDRAVSLPPGGLLVIASDGLYEGSAPGSDVPYGYDRPRALLSSAALWRRPGEAIVEALLGDWRRHVGDDSPADDTTVLVVRRP